jgi:hypothetical protein
MVLLFNIATRYTFYYNHEKAVYRNNYNMHMHTCKYENTRKDEANETSTILQA